MLLFLVTPLFSQIGGQSVHQFLNISTSARQIALGGEVLTLEGDINQPLWNPATITNAIDRRFSANYSNYIAGIKIGSASYAREISRHFGTVYANISYLDYGTLIEADEQGNELGIFKSADLALTVGYAYNIPFTDFFLGANVKFINATIANFVSRSVAFDFSVLYRNDRKPYVFTAVVRNLGSQISTFNGTQEPLPLKVSIGASYKLKYVPLKWFLTFDNLQYWNLSEPNPSNQITDLEGNITPDSISFFDNTLRHFVVGAELFSDKVLNVRLGYNFRRAAELQLQNVRTFTGLSYGFGIKLNRFTFNYANSRLHSAKNISTFSLEIDLDKRRR